MTLIGKVQRTGKRMIERAAATITDTTTITVPTCEHSGFPLSLQFDDYSCGLQCTSMVIRYFVGKDLSDTTLRRKLRTTKTNGTEARDIVRVLRDAGLKTVRRDGAGRTSDALRHEIRRNAVIIALVPGPDAETHHWVCVYGYEVKSGRLLFRDPSIAGLRRPFVRGPRIHEYITVRQ